MILLYKFFDDNYNVVYLCEYCLYENYLLLIIR